MTGEKLLELLMGSVQEPSPVPFRASPGRSFARAIGHPWSEDPALDRTRVVPNSAMPDATAYEAGGSTSTGLYDPVVDTITYSENPTAPLKKIMGHELTHPIQRRDVMLSDPVRARLWASMPRYKPEGYHEDALAYWVGKYVNGDTDIPQQIRQFIEQWAGK